MARGVRLDGATRRPAAARALKQLETRTIYILKHETYFGVCVNQLFAGRCERRK